MASGTGVTATLTDKPLKQESWVPFHSEPLSIQNGLLPTIASASRSRSLLRASQPVLPPCCRPQYLGPLGLLPGHAHPRGQGLWPDGLFSAPERDRKSPGISLTILMLVPGLDMHLIKYRRKGLSTGMVWGAVTASLKSAFLISSGEFCTAGLTGSETKSNHTGGLNVKIPNWK